jgi:hypothetical protein
MELTHSALPKTQCDGKHSLLIDGETKAENLEKLQNIFTVSVISLRTKF